MPKDLTPDTATLYGKMTDGLGDFLDNCLENPYMLDKTLEPGEYSVITIGTLFQGSAYCAPLPRAVFAQRDSHNFQACDSRMPARSVGGNHDVLPDPAMAIGVKLVFYGGKSSMPETCILLPCGQVSYPDH